jgi:hypothetical protein
MLLLSSWVGELEWVGELDVDCFRRMVPTELPSRTGVQAHQPYSCVQVAAIRGACPAGGCCLSLCCDFRIMTEFGHIGLNEVALGIAVRLITTVGGPVWSCSYPQWGRG